MTIESVTYISDLNENYPAFDDYGSEGDDHIRNIKKGLNNTFSNFTGAAVTATEAELNILDGVTASAAELNYLDITTPGTAQTSKALTISATDTWTAAGMTCADLGTITTVDINGGTIAGAALETSVTGVTQSAGDNDTSLATTAYVDRRNVSFAVGLSGAQSIGTSIEILNFNTEEHDDGSDFATGTYLFTAPMNGVYQFCLTCNYASSSALYVEAIISKDEGGGGQVRIAYARSLYPNTAEKWVSCSGIIKLSAGDTVGAYGRTQSAHNLETSETRFSGALLYATA